MAAAHDLARAHALFKNLKYRVFIAGWRLWFVIGPFLVWLIRMYCEQVAFDVIRSIIGV